MRTMPRRITDFTPLHWAAFQRSALHVAGSPEMVELLLQNNAQSDLKDNNKHTALQAFTALFERAKTRKRERDVTRHTKIIAALRKAP